MNDEICQTDARVISYKTMRRAIGVLGALLPFVLWLGSSSIGCVEHVLDSISAYYHSSMGDFFVGSLCAVALFLYAYRGYDTQDDRAGNVAAILALGVAFFPLEPGLRNPNIPTWTGTVHLTCAAGFFLVLTYFSLVLFRKSKGKMTPEKMARNRIYFLCGIVMLLCLVFIGVMMLITGEEEKGTYVFWGEAVALLAFSTSWLIKGDLVFKDK